MISALPTRRLGVPEDQAALHFGTVGPDVGNRYLYMSGEPAFELSFWCGSCPFLFERQYGANVRLSDGREPMRQLEQPLDAVDDAIFDTFSPLLAEGDYLPLLLEVQPELVAPNDERDYFTHEQVATWGIRNFWSLPENPRSFYYRTFETAVDSDAHLYEFVVPMVPPSWTDRDRVRHYVDLMGEGVAPTAVALSGLDVCAPATTGDDADFYFHWGLTHYLLDGHHKMLAAARSGSTVQLLALVSLAGGLADPAATARLPELLARPRARRGVGGNR
nr:hypothetical protein [Gordonia araii]